MKVAVVGAGVIGQLRARAVRGNAETALLGVFDPVTPSAERAVRGTTARACADLAALLDLPGLEAVIVSSPVHHHESAVIAALERGLHVLCEKPLSNSLASCRRMVETARARGVTLATGFNHRYYPSIAYLKRCLDQGRIGALDHLRVFGGHDGLHNFRADWQYRAPESGGGAMMDVGVHLTDLVHYLLGDVAEVYGVARNEIWRVPGSEDNAVAVFRSAAGVPAIYQATWTEWKGYRFYVDAYGDRGMVRAYYAPMYNLLITQPHPGGPRHASRRFYPEIIVREKLRSWTSTALRSFQAELADFLRLVGGERGLAIADGFAGLRAVEIADAVYRSTRTREAVHLAPRS